jgi:alpha/beta superfamily hydrolase
MEIGVVGEEGGAADGSDAQVAVLELVDEATHATYSEQAAFIGDPDGRFLSFLHHPSGPARGCLVICSSQYQDSLATYRQEVVLARNLVRHGVAVARLHYRGIGNSDDPPDCVTATTMTADIEQLVAYAEREVQFATEPARIGLLGVGFGAILAAGVASRRPGAPAIFWRPVTTGKQYYRDLFRAGRVAATRGVDPEVVEVSSIDTMRQEGWVEVLGQAIYLGAYEDAENRSLAGELGTDPRPILLAQMGYSERLDVAYDRLVKEWCAAGHDAQALVFKQPGGWWYVEDSWSGEEYDSVFLEFVDQLTDWLVARWEN